jgi:hypothetical protein
LFHAVIDRHRTIVLKNRLKVYESAVLIYQRIQSGPVAGGAMALSEARKRFFLKKEAKTFIVWCARCRNARANA